MRRFEHGGGAFLEALSSCPRSGQGFFVSLLQSGSYPPDIRRE